VYADFTLTNLFTQKSVGIRALVDTGATEVFVTPEIAKQLGFDVEEVRQKPVVVADGRRIFAPCLAPVEIQWAVDRSFCMEVMVLGDECLVGVLALEVLDLVVDPKRLQLVPNPKHPNGPYKRA
jgi:clan AA aspartic protease